MLSNVPLAATCEPRPNIFSSYSPSTSCRSRSCTRTRHRSPSRERRDPNPGGDGVTFEDALRADVRALLHEEVEMLRPELREMIRAEMQAAAHTLSARDPGEILLVKEAAAIYKETPKTIRAKIRS